MLEENNDDPFSTFIENEIDDCDGFGEDTFIEQNKGSDNDTTEEIKRRSSIEDSSSSDDELKNKDLDNDTIKLKRITIDHKPIECIKGIRWCIGFLFVGTLHSMITLGMFFWCYYDSVHYEFVGKVDNKMVLQHPLIWILWFGRLVSALLMSLFGLVIVLIGSTTIESFFMRWKINLWLTMKTLSCSIINYISLIVVSHIYGVLVYISYPLVIYVLFPFVGTGEFVEDDLLNSFITFLVYLMGVLSVVWMILMIPLLLIIVIMFTLMFRWMLLKIGESYDDVSQREVIISILRRRGFLRPKDSRKLDHTKTNLLN